MAIIDELIAVLGYDLQGEGELRRFNAGLDNAEKQARSAARGIGIFGVAVGSFIGGMALQAVNSLASTLTGLPSSVISVGSTFEKLETTLTTIEGSATKAKEALAWVQDFAATTPYDLNQVADAFVRMRAYGLDPASGQLETIGNAASAMGKGLMQGVEAIADAAQGENERLKEFGVRAKANGNSITYSWQQNGQEMSKTVKKNGTDIVKGLMEIFSRFDGAMDAQSKTWEGMTSNLGDMWTGFLKQIGDSGFYDYVKQRLRGVLDQLQQWEKDGTLKGWAESISKAMTFVARTIIRFGQHIYTIGRAAYYAADGIVSLISRLTGLDKTLTAGLLGAGALGATRLGRAALMAIARRVPMVAAALLIDDIMTGLKNPADSYIGSLKGGAEAFTTIKASWDDLSTAAAGLADNLEKLYGIKITSKMSWGEFIDRELLLFMRDMNNVIRDLTAALDALNLALTDPGEAWKRFVDVIIAQLDRLLLALDEKLNGALSALGLIRDPNKQRTTGEVTEPAKPEILNTEEYLADDPTRNVETGEPKGFIRDIPPTPTPRDSFTPDARDLALQMQQEEAARVANSGGKWADAVSSGVSNLVSALSSSAAQARSRLAAIITENVTEDRATRDRSGGTVDRQLNGMDRALELIRNAANNNARVEGVSPGETIMNDNSQDNRQYPMSIQTTINQNIQQSTQAPSAAASATAGAVNSAAGQAARIQQEPAQ